LNGKKINSVDWYDLEWIKFQHTLKKQKGLDFF
jgi:hypothetical protein